MKKTKMIKRRSWITFLLTVVLVLPLQAQRTISVFKNGTAFVRKTDTISASNGKSILTELPEALYGTFWVGSPTATVRQMKNMPKVAAKQAEFAGFKELLKANKGKKVRLILAYQEPQEAVVQDVVNNFAIFKAKDKWISTDISKIETLEFFDEPVVYTTEYGRGLEITWGNEKKNQQMILMYLRKGIGWMPEYLIELDNSENAKVTLKANLINDAEDITNTDLNFVVGAPQFSFLHTQSPLTSNQSLQQLLNGIGMAGGDATPSSLRNTAMYKSAASDEATGQGYEIDAGGSQAEDLYYYTLKNITLPKGGRAAFAILEIPVPVKHQYSVHIPQNQVIRYPVYNTRNQPQIPDERTNPVYHTIELQNQSKHPWTAGSAFVVKNEDNVIKPLAQSQMRYTSKGGEAEVRISEATDISVTDKEQETGREPDNRPKEGNWDAISVDGTVTVKNYKDQAVTLEVKRTIVGDPVKSDVNWDIKKEVSYSPYNQLSTVTWTLTLKPGEEQKINYKYKYSVRK